MRRRNAGRLPRSRRRNQHQAPVLPEAGENLGQALINGQRGHGEVSAGARLFHFPREAGLPPSQSQSVQNKETRQEARLPHGHGVANSIAVQKILLDDGE